MALAFSTADPEITLEEESAKKIIFKVEIPPDSRARTKDVGVTLTLVGKILADTASAGNAYGMVRCTVRKERGLP